MKNTAAIEKIMMDVEGKFWTRRDELVEELEELDYIVVEINSEYVVVSDAQSEDDAEYILYFGGTERTKYIERVMEAF